jgi:hypothetical protein
MRGRACLRTSSMKRTPTSTTTPSPRQELRFTNFHMTSRQRSWQITQKRSMKCHSLGALKAHDRDGYVWQGCHSRRYQTVYIMKNGRILDMAKYGSAHGQDHYLRLVDMSKRIACSSYRCWCHQSLVDHASHAALIISLSRPQLLRLPISCQCRFQF